MRARPARLALVLLLFANRVGAVIVDRTAIIVGAKTITESEIVRRIRLTAFQNGELADLTAAARREAAQRLIDLKLVEHEMDLGHYVRISPDQAKELLSAFAAEHFGASAEALRMALANTYLTPGDLQSEFAEQADFLSFVNLRFRPAVEVSDQDVEKYYHENIEPKNASNPVALSDVRATIEQALTNQRTDSDLAAWLLDQRKRIRISYLVRDLQ